MDARALVTLVGLLPRVQARVLDEVVLVFESLLADLALVGPLSCRNTWNTQEPEGYCCAWRFIPKQQIKCISDFPILITLHIGLHTHFNMSRISLQNTSCFKFLHTQLNHFFTFQNLTLKRYKVQSRPGLYHCGISLYNNIFKMTPQYVYTYILM